MSLEIVGIAASLLGLLGGIYPLIRSIFKGIRLEARIGRLSITIESSGGTKQKLDLEAKNEESIRQFLNSVEEVRDAQKLEAK